MEHKKLDEFIRSRGKGNHRHKSALNKAKSVVHAAFEVSGQGLKSPCEESTEKLSNFNPVLIDVDKETVQEYQQSDVDTDKYVNTNPCTALNIAAVVSFLAGFFVATRR